MNNHQQHTQQFRFIVDVNVGRLATWLRVMGYDTLFPDDTDDNALVRTALREDRVLVTRDAGIGQRRAARLGQLRVALITVDDLRGQLRQLVTDLGLTLDNGFSRCVRCNQTLTPVDKARVEAQLPPYVLQTQDRFHQCPGCRRVYWPGTHWSNMKAELGRVCQEMS